MKNIKTENINNIKAVILDDSANVVVTSRDCVYELLIEYNNGEVEIVSIEDINNIESRRDLTRLFGKCLKDSSLTKNIVDGKIQDSNNVQLYKISDVKKMEEYEKALNELDVEEEKKKSNVGKVLATVGILGLVATIGGCAAYSFAKAKEEAEVVQEEVQDEIVKPNMEGQEWDYYIDTAISNEQKQAWTAVGDFLLSFNSSQEWMERTNNNGEFSRFGFTPEETMAFYLRFNDLTDEELITICNGANINADEIMDLSNDFIEKMISYYVISNEPSGIEKLFNDEHDKEVVKTFEEHHAMMMKGDEDDVVTINGSKEYHMRYEKQMFSDYFNSDVEGKETKARQASTSYLLRTMLLSDSIISSMYNYEGVIVLDAINSDKQVEAKTGLFDDVFMATFIGGFDDFKEENVIKNLGYNPDKYTIILDDVNRSIADMSCGEQEQKLRDADNFRIEIETSSQVVEDNRKALEAELSVYVDKNGKIDASQVAQAIDNMEFDGEQATIDELTKYSYDNSLIADMLSKKLVELEKNAINADTFMELVEEIMLANLNKLDSNTTKKSSGSSKTTTTEKVVLKNDPAKSEKEEHAAAVNELINRGATPEQAEAMTKEAEEDAAHKIGAITTEEKEEKQEEAKEKTVDLTQMYNAVYNHFAGEVVYSTNLAYDASWANSSDKLVRDNYNKAKAQGLEYKKAKEEAAEDLKRQEEERRKQEEELKKLKEQLEGGVVLPEQPTPTVAPTVAPTSVPAPETPQPTVAPPAEPTV